MLSELPCYGCPYCKRQSTRQDETKTDDIARRFPGLKSGKYILGVLDGCDRDHGYVSIIGVGKFYISPSGNKMWDVIRLMVETDNEDGYAFLSSVVAGWQNYFTTGHGSVPPRDSGYSYVGGAREFFRYVHGLGRTGMFRIERTPKPKAR